MTKTLAVALLIITSSFVFSGCASKESSVQANTAFESRDVFYVERLPADGRGINRLIAGNLRTRGFSAETDLSNVPQNAEWVVTYQDNWMWDMTMFMLRLNLQIRNRNGDTVANAKSYRPSLQRLTPEEMVDETLDEVFAKGWPQFVTPEVEDDTEKDIPRSGARATQTSEATHSF